MARKAEELAAILIHIYTDRKKRFILTQKEFTEISGKGKFRKKFLRAVDGFLREKGYILIDLHKEKDIVGVLRIETIAHWDIPELHDDTHENQFAEHDDDERDSEEETSRIDTSF